MPRKKQAPMLTAVELEFMTALWSLGEASVREVLGQLASDRDLAYTSGATVMRILETKGFVRSRKVGRTFRYEPTLDRDAYQTRSLQHLSRTLFDGAPATLVARLLDDGDLSDETLVEIRKQLDRKLKR